MAKTKMHELGEFGQSLWLDFISRPLLETGKLKTLIDSGLRGMTSNPTIFNQAISQSKDYDASILKLKEGGKSTFEIYDELTVRDIQQACDIFRPVFDATKKLDGYVSLEINPKIANDAAASIKEGKRLFAKVARPNVMIKVPATDAGFPVIEELIASGINVNVTLIFSLAQYVHTVEAYFEGLKRYSKTNRDLSGIHSVASVFVSRIDTSVDKTLDELIAKNGTLKSSLEALKGRAAVANCRIIFEKFKELFAAGEFKELAKMGANEQRVLWGSTGTKNPNYSDIKYVTELIARPTVNTVPEKTMEAFVDHGTIKEALVEDVARARELVATLKKQGIDVDQVCAKLLLEGVVSFEKAFEELTASIEQKARNLSLSAK